MHVCWWLYDWLDQCIKEIFCDKKISNFVKSVVLPLLTWRNKLTVVGASGRLLLLHTILWGEVCPVFVVDDAQKLL